jgi:hypothetical protein
MVRRVLRRSELQLKGGVLSCSSFIVNVYTELCSTIVSQNVRSHSFIEGDGAISTFYVGYFEDCAFDLDLNASQNITSVSVLLAVESTLLLSIAFPRE